MTITTPITTPPPPPTPPPPTTTACSYVSPSTHTQIKLKQLAMLVSETTLKKRKKSQASTLVYTYIAGRETETSRPWRAEYFL